METKSVLCCLRIIYIFHNISFLIHSQLLSDCCFANIHASHALLCHHPDFFCREVGAQQTAYLLFFLGKQVSVKRLHPGIKSVINSIDNRIKIGPHQKSLDRDFFVGNPRYAAQLVLILRSGSSRHQTDNTQLLQQYLFKEGAVML